MFNLFLNEVAPNPVLDAFIVIIVVIVLTSIIFFSFIFPRILKCRKNKKGDHTDSCHCCCKK